MFFDMILLFFVNLFCPEEPTYQRTQRRSSDANWVILDELEDDRRLDNDDPYINGEYDDGPDW